MPNLPAACLIVCAVAAPLSAQSGPRSEPGASAIRLTTMGPDSRSLTGTPIRQTPDSIRLVLSGTADTVSVAAVSLHRIEDFRGRRSNWDRGALAGALILGIAGAVAAPLIVESIGDGPSSRDAGTIGVGFAGGALAGGILGAGIGALSSRNRWSARPHAGVRRIGTRNRMHAGLALAITF